MTTNHHLVRQAIVTKYIGPSNVKGSRVKATADAGSVTLHWDYNKNVDENHIAAAEALASKFNWAGHWYMGALPRAMNGCFAFTCVDDRIEAGYPVFSLPLVFA